jgi:hypothetical protein
MPDGTEEPAVVAVVAADIAEQVEPVADKPERWQS